MFSSTTFDSFLKSTYGDWFRLSCVVSFSLDESSAQNHYVIAHLQTGRCYRVGPAGHASKEKAATWLADYVESLCKTK